MTRPSVSRFLRYRRRPLAALAAVMVVTGALSVAGTAPLAAAQQPAMNCPGETYPAAGAPRNDTAQPPYAIPFSAQLNGGYLTVSSPSSTLSVTLGGPEVNGVGKVHATACGLVYLPNETGGIAGHPYGAPGNNGADQYNNNFVFSNPIPVSFSIRGSGGGLPVISGWGSADGFLGASFSKTPAANGGINVDFSSTAKSTAIINPAALAGVLSGPNLPPAIKSLIDQIGSSSPQTGGECTLVLGNMLAAGVPPGDLRPDAPNPVKGQPPVSAITGLTYAQETTNATLTSGTSTAYSPTTGKPIASITGQPVTGPITAAQAKLVSDTFPVGKIDPSTPPSPDAPNAGTTAPSTLCKSSMASTLNGLLGLPSPIGSNVFSAPGSFGIHTSA